MKIQLASCTVDLDRHLLRRADGTQDKLTALEQKLLDYLLRAGKTVSRAELMEEVWEWSPSAIKRVQDDPRSRLPVECTYNDLRKKIEATPSAAVNLITIHGVGYLLDGAVPVDEVPRADPWTARRLADLDKAKRRLGRGSPLVVVGPAGIGKTTLVERLLQQLTTDADRTAWVGIAGAESIRRTNLENVSYGMALDIARQLSLDDEAVDAVWAQRRDPIDRLFRYIAMVLTKEVAGDLYLVLDPADGLTQMVEIADRLLSAFRAYLEDARRGGGVWDRLRLVLIINTTALLTALDNRRSPFNLSVPLMLEGLPTEDTAELLRGAGLAVRDDQPSDVMALTGGNPRLLLLLAEEAVNRGLDAVLSAPLAEGLLRDHCDRMWREVAGHPATYDALSACLGGKPADPARIEHLIAATVIDRARQPANGLYRRFLAERFGR